MSQKSKEIVLHSSGGVPCLTGDFYANRHGPVVAVLGGRGKLGSRLVKHWVRQERSVFAIDLAVSCECSRTWQSGIEATMQAWHEQFRSLWSLLAEQAGLAQPLESLVTASRYSSANDSEGASSILREFDHHLSAGLRAPLAAAVAALPRFNLATKGTIVFLGSVNAFTISHQPMGYHSAHSGLVQAVRYLSVHLPEFLNAYCILIGVLRINPPFPHQQSRFNGVEPKEIFETLDFLLKGGNPSLAGEPIILGSGRTSLDATAVAQNRFGDISDY